MHGSKNVKFPNRS